VVLSQRERQLAIGIGSVGALLLLIFYLIVPWMDWGADLQKKAQEAEKNQQDYQALIAHRNALVKAYDAMQKGGVLKTDVSEAQSQVDRAVYDWAAQSGVIIATAGNQGQTTYDAKTGFTEVGYTVTCTGTTVGVAKLLYQIETASIPLRIKLVHINSRKDGADDLLIELNLSTLCVAPKPVTGTTPVATSDARF
jgi:hypothetical protein